MVLGNSLLSAHYLEIYTGIQPGQPYQNLWFVIWMTAWMNCHLLGAPSLQFKVLRHQAKAVMYLDVRNASKFDLIVGFLPNNGLREG